MSVITKKLQTPLFSLLLGPAFMLLCLLLPAPFGMNQPSWLVLGLTFWMASWWPAWLMSAVLARASTPLR